VPRLRHACAAALSLLLLSATAAGADEKERIAASIDASSARWNELALTLWRHPELGYQEEASSRLLQQALGEAGFRVRSGVAGMPTAFVATAGKGRPAIGILAEFDALPGLSQAAVPHRQPVVEGAPGHACGHHLFGVGSLAAAVALSQWMREAEVPGTIRVYGTPAEEGGAGKAYMARAGLFDDLDVALHWHPSDHNEASFASSLANKSAKFRFRGVAAHAAAAPERGRSALDGVEAMDYMLNLMREHVPQETRIHYVITDGGSAPNIVPERAEVFLYVRHPDARVLAAIWERALAAARGAALGTGTEVEWEVIHGTHSLLPNETLSRVVDTELRRVGGVHYDAEERRFAEAIRKTLIDPDRELGSQEQIDAFAYRLTPASTDVGDVSWLVPTAGLRTATWVPGTPAHSWQAVAAGGTAIGLAGMRNAAVAMAWTAADLLRDPELLAAARAEFERRRGPDFHYAPMVGDRDPPLDYRR
jgi:aminobenzoyl-glutamate utilization protein B